MGLNRVDRTRSSVIFSFSIFVLVLFVFTIQSVHATSSIARQVETFCAPLLTTPDVNSCSSCHSTTNNRGPNDLTAAGMWSLSSATFINFCPTAATPPPNTTPPGSTPSPGTGMGMSTGSSSSSMGRGSGGSLDDDDDDDEMEEDDDDDDNLMPPPIPPL